MNQFIVIVDQFKTKQIMDNSDSEIEIFELMELDSENEVIECQESVEQELNNTNEIVWTESILNEMEHRDPFFGIISYDEHDEQSDLNTMSESELMNEMENRDPFFGRISFDDQSALNTCESELMHSTTATLNCANNEITSYDNYFSYDIPDVLYGQCLLQPVSSHDMTMDDSYNDVDYNTVEIGTFKQSETNVSIIKTCFYTNFSPDT